MTVQISPAAELNLKNDTTTADSIESRISNVTELVDNALILYGNQEARIEIMDDIDTKVTDLTNGPWASLAYSNETRIANGVVEVANNRNNTNSVWDFMFTSPVKDVYVAPSNPNVISTITNPVADVDRGRYDSIFREHIQRINIPGGIKDSITNAVSQLNNLNTVGYQTALNQAKDIIVSPLLEELLTLRNIINAVENEINNPQSVMYKPGSSFGPFSTDKIASFQLPPLMLQIRDGINAIVPILREVYTRIDELVNIPEDVLARVSLLNVGLEQNPNNPNEFSIVKPQEKDPWGIRFTYTSQQAGNLFAQQNQVNEFRDVAARNASGINRRNNTQRQQELEASRDILEQTTISMQKDFYFQLLPAIKSNLPVSGGTDVPGAMPGIQFRIENNIVKHKIPGFAPVYQPIGIDSIKCTLVGMFTGSDGLDLSASYLQDLSAGLLNRGQNLPVGSKQEYSLAQNGPTLSAFDSSNNPYLNGELDPRNNPLVFNDGVDVPIPSQSRSRTATPVAVISEDAFRGAQDFYNEIVSQGREVEVELNLRKGTGAYPGGSVGPFRDPETGNPKFRGLIKRLDLYYVRRDRCWFIIDLEITESGLIGKECLNLTNVIEEAVDLFEGVTKPIGLTKEQLDQCFKDPKEYELTGNRTGQALVIDRATGLSYFYNKATGNLLSDKTYPNSYQQTQSYLYQQRVGGEIENPKSDLISSGSAWRRLHIVAMMTELASLYAPSNTSLENDLSINWIPADKSSLTLHGVSWRYDKNVGKFYLVYDKNGNLVEDPEEAARKAKTLNELINENLILFNDVGSVDKIGNFILNEYNPLLKVPDNDCSKLLDEITAEAQNNEQRSPNSTRSGGSSPQVKVVPDIINNNSTSSQQELEEVNIIQPSSNEDSQALPKEVVESIENGVLNRLIEQALSEYVKVLDEDLSPFNPTALSPTLTNTLKSQAQASTLYTRFNNPVTFSLIGNSRVQRSESDISEVSINIRYTFDKTYYLFKSNRLYKFDPVGASRVPRSAKVIIKSYLQNGVKVYKIDGLVISTNLQLRVDPDTQPVAPAPVNQEPSNNNTPSTS